VRSTIRHLLVPLILASSFSSCCASFWTSLHCLQHDSMPPFQPAMQSSRPPPGRPYRQHHLHARLPAYLRAPPPLVSWSFHFGYLSRPRPQYHLRQCCLHCCLLVGPSPLLYEPFSWPYQRHFFPPPQYEPFLESVRDSQLTDKSRHQMAP
jgi:hypothetical protein